MDNYFVKGKQGQFN